MRVCAIIAMVICLLTVMSPVVHSVIFVSGSISRDEVWTPEKGPYIITGDTVIPFGRKLVIEEGTTVLFEKIDFWEPYGTTVRAELIVRGRLEVNGSLERPVIFAPNDSTFIGDWGGIVFDNADGYMRNCKVSHAETGISVLQGSFRLENITLENSFTGVRIDNGASLEILRSVIKQNNYGVDAGGNGKIQGCSLVNNSYGIYLRGPNEFLISHNEISSNTFGIYVEGEYGNTIIEKNDFNVEVNNYGIYISEGRIQSISYNNFYYDDLLDFDPTRELWYIQNFTPSNIDARNNYWDTTNTLLIDGFILDGKDMPGVGTVIYTPFLLSKVPDTFDAYNGIEEPGSGIGNEDLPLKLHVAPGSHLVSIPMLSIDVISSDVTCLACTIYEWDGNSYSLRHALDFLDYIPGTGFWIENSETVSIDFASLETPPTDSVSIRLSIGWNLVGCPVNKNFDIFDLRVVTDTNTYDFYDAVDAGILEGFWEYDGDYILSLEIKPWVGYWIKAHEECELVFSLQ